MSTPVEAAAIGDRLKLLRILLAHASEIGAIIGHVEEIKNATTITAKWEAFKGAGNILAPIVQELKDAYAEGTRVTLMGEGYYEEKAVALGLDWGKLLTLVDKLQKALPLLLELLDLFGGE